MEFNNRLYHLRKQNGLSQEELANRLHVTRQTISKWETGDSTPDMGKLAAMSDLFEISLDELVMGKEPRTKDAKASRSELVNVLNEKVLTSDNKKKARRVLKIIGIVFAGILLIDIISMMIYFILYGIPQ
ncbi:MAG: helix-turn-helix domain-containing protein [Eubacteriales bacterium]|nr:helix-turn-helix domain-containing protein [Eubacteriales bacterium]